MQTIARCAIACISFLVLVEAARAQTSVVPSGTIQGRVINPTTGQYIANARLTVSPASLEIFSDEGGYYRLSSVPIGTVEVTAFYTGLQPRTETVSVSPGEIVQRDIQLVPIRRHHAAGTDSEPVMLPRYAVSASRDIDATALAIHEQRFAPNIKAVVSAEEFGYVAENNVAEFLKFLPGVTVGYQAGVARNVSLNGVGPASVPVTIDGFNVAAANSDNPTGRTVLLDMQSLNTLSRVEVVFAPTPESPASALAGSINLVPRSSLDRTRLTGEASLALTMRDDARHFKRVPGARRHPTRVVHPEYKLSTTVPVTPRFGFTVSATESTNSMGMDDTNPQWRGASAPTNGTTFPHTTPDRPYLTNYNVNELVRVLTRRSVGMTLDFRPTPADRISVGFQYSSFDGWLRGNGRTFNITRVLPGNFGPAFTRGNGVLTLSQTEWNRFSRGFMPTLTWRHDGPTWRMDAGAAYSQQTDYLRGAEIGAFREVGAQRPGVTIAFDEITYLRPGRITVTDTTTGLPVDPYVLASYALNYGWDSHSRAYALARTAHANVRRTFHGRVPLTLKAGLDARASVSDVRQNSVDHLFVGADGRRSTTPAGGDDSAAPFLDPLLSQRPGLYGFPPMQAVSNSALWVFRQENPQYFTVSENAAYRNAVGGSKHADEIISAGFLRADAALLGGRLKLVTGLRAEQTNITAEGPLTDPTRNYQRDRNGEIVRAPSGAPLLLVPTSDALGVSRLTYIERGTRVKKESFGVFPSINASYSLRENLIARAAWYESMGRPSFNQYAGGLTLPSDRVSVASPIVVNNAALKPWTARSALVKLEYYFTDVGQITVGAFRRDFRNATSGSIFAATPEFLELYGLDAAAYEGYPVSTQVNVPGVVRMTGVDFHYKQALTFLPHWARGLQVFVNGSAQRATGPHRGTFPGSTYFPRSGSYGVSFMRDRYVVRLNCSYRSQRRGAAIAPGPSIAPDTYSWIPRQLFIETSGEYYFRRKLAVFASLRNLTDVPEESQVFGRETPPHARLRNRYESGSLWTFGFKGSF